MQKRPAQIGLLAALIVLVSVPLEAQIDTRERRLPLGPARPAGEPVVPFVESWLANPDGTFTFSMGYFNFNTEETVEIPLGPNNYIEPAELDGMQPTHFPGPDRGGYQRHERGVFTVTVPASYAGGARSFVWHLNSAEEEHVVRGTVGTQALQLDYGPRALGSVPPLLAFSEGGATGQHPTGIEMENEISTRVGVPVQITVWVTDPSERSREALGPLWRETPMGVTWFKHQGPVGDNVSFERVGEPWEEPGAREAPAPAGFPGASFELPRYRDWVAPEGGSSTVMATFADPGEYLLRVRVDNFRAEDSLPDDQCCWTNGWVRVRVQ